MDSRSEASSLPPSVHCSLQVQAPAWISGEDTPRADEGFAGSTQRRRLLYFLNTFDRGGAELGLLFLARSGFFAPFDARVLAICRGKGGLERELAASGLRAEAFFPSDRMTWQHMAAALPRLIRLLRRERPALLVLSLPQANIVGRFAASLTGVPAVVSFEHNTRLSRRLFEVLCLLLSPRVGIMFADCARTAKIAQRRYFGRSVRPFIVPLCSFPRQPARRPANVPLLHSALRVASVGRLTRTKNHRCLIEAVALLHRQGIAVSAEIFGDGPLRDELQHLATARGVAKLVDFRGFVARWWEHSHANVFVVTSLHEGLCIVALEAMWAGIPVIAPSSGGILDYGTDANMLLLPDLEPKTLAGRLREVMAAPREAARRTLAARRTVADMFSEDAVAETLRNISNQLSVAPTRTERWGSGAVLVDSISPSPVLEPSMISVSVCMTCYNETDYVESAIHSVLNQTAIERIREIIVVDDGSTDGSQDKILTLAEQTGRIHLVLQDNQGVSAARNRAMREATGDLIAFLDGDDLWVPNKIEKQITAFVDSTVGLVYSDYVDFHDKQVARRMLVCVRRLSGRGLHLARDYYLKDAPIIPSTVIMRRCVLETIGGFDQTIRIGEDTDYWMRTALAGFGVSHVSGGLTLKRRHNRNLTMNLEHWVTVFEYQTRKFAEGYSFLQPLVSRRLSRRYAKVAESLMANGQIRRSVVYLLRALRHDPRNVRGYAYALALPVYAAGGSAAISGAKRAYHLMRQRQEGSVTAQD
jgi:glycosyltransferase involved in cell wall biosynthesis